MSTRLNCILLIDDDEPTNFLNRVTLEQSGRSRSVRVVQSGQEAIDYLMRCPTDPAGYPRPDLIFLDINMPAMDGWEFLEGYRALPPAYKADIVLIMLTTSLNPDDELRTHVYPEIAGFEAKPLNEGRLNKLLEKYFRTPNADNL